MDMNTILNSPLFTSILTGVIMYIILNIYESYPTLSAILGEIPIGLLILYFMINKSKNINDTQEWIISMIYSNIIVFIMWVVISYMLYSNNIVKSIYVLYGGFVWLLLSIEFHHNLNALYAGDTFIEEFKQ